jgi:CheY-like chemotaxis protein
MLASIGRHGTCRLGKDVASCDLMMTPADKSILVVEDDKLLSWSLTQSLTKNGFDVHPVSNGADAIAMLEKSGFDIVLLDYQLPDVDGLRVAHRIRQDQPRAVIFLITAFQLSELEVESGLIDAYFNKPIDLQQLHHALASLPRLPASHVTAGRPRSRI